MEVSGQLYAQGNNPWYPLDRRLGGPQTRSGRGCLQKNIQSKTIFIMAQVTCDELFYINFPINTNLKTKLSLSLSKYSAMKTYPLFN
jgi:hypothetical protein